MKKIIAILLLLAMVATLLYFIVYDAGGGDNNDPATTYRTELSKCNSIPAPDKRCIKIAREFAEFLKEKENSVLDIDLENFTNPKDFYVDAYELLGQTARKQEAHEIAVTAYQRLIYYKPQTSPYYAYLADSLSILGSFSRAERFAHLAVQLAPFSWRPYYYKGDVFRRAGDYTQALAAYKEAIRRAPSEDKTEIQKNIDTLNSKIKLDNR